MKFDAVVGNPPYQIINKGNGNGADPVYNYFLDTARAISDTGSLIHPARFLFNAGKTPKEWNAKMLKDRHFKVVNYWANSLTIFPNVDIKGGVATTLWNEKEDYGGIGVFIPYEKLFTIKKKVVGQDFKSIASLVYPRDLYRLTETLYEENPQLSSRQSKGHRYDCGSGIFNIMPEVFLENEPNDNEEYAKMYGLIKGKRTYRFVKKTYIKTSHRETSVIVVQRSVRKVRKDIRHILRQSVDDILSSRYGYDSSFFLSQKRHHRHST